MGQRMCACVCDKSLQSCLTLFYPMDCSPPGSPVHGILVHGIPQARILEWVAVPSFRGSSWPRDGNCVSYMYLHRLVGSLTTSTTWEAPTGQRTYASKSPSMGVFPVCLHSVCACLFRYRPDYSVIKFLIFPNLLCEKRCLSIVLICIYLKMSET